MCFVIGQMPLFYLPAWSFDYLETDGRKYRKQKDQENELWNIKN